MPSCETETQAIDDSEFIKTLFPTAFKSIYGQEEKENEENGGNERTEGNEENKEDLSRAILFPERCQFVAGKQVSIC